MELRVGFKDRGQCLLTGAINGVKVNDAVLFLVLEVTQNSVDAFAVSDVLSAGLSQRLGLPDVAFCTNTHSSVGTWSSREIRSLDLSRRSIYWYRRNLSGAASASF